MISIEGLDFSGKSTFAKILSELTGFEYIKIKKGSLLDYSNHNSEKEITRRIIEEISLGINKKQDIILDRSYLSALITGKIYDNSLDLDSLLQNIPNNLAYPRIGLIIITPYKIAKNRINKPLTNQDKRVLRPGYDEYQKLMVEIGTKRGYIKYNNSLNRNEDKLRKDLEKILIRYSL